MENCQERGLCTEWRRTKKRPYLAATCAARVMKFLFLGNDEPPTGGVKPRVLSSKTTSRITGVSVSLNCRMDSNACFYVAGRTVSQDRFTFQTSGVSPSQVNEAILDASRFYSYCSSRRLVSNEDSRDVGYAADHCVNVVDRLFSYPLSTRDFGNLFRYAEG